MFTIHLLLTFGFFIGGIQKLDYHWVETGHIQTEYFVRALSWNLEGTRLLLGGRLLQLWHSKSNPETQDDIYPKNISGGAKFQVGNDGESEDEAKDSSIKSSVPKVHVYGSGPIEEGKVFDYDSKSTSHEGKKKTTKLINQMSLTIYIFYLTKDACEGYELAWETRTATPVRLLCFSPDGTLFATAGMNDPLVKVWYQDKPCKKT